MGREQLRPVEVDFNATSLRLVTPADADNLALIVVDKKTPDEYSYAKIAVSSKKIGSTPSSSGYAVNVFILPLGEITLRGSLDETIKSLVDTEKEIAKNDVARGIGVRAAVGVVEYTGSGNPAFETILHFAGIHFHRERENYKIRRTMQA